MIEFVKVFLEVAKDLRSEYIEKWLNGEVKDYDLDMILIDERNYRKHHYKKVFGDTI